MKKISLTIIFLAISLLTTSFVRAKVNTSTQDNSSIGITDKDSTTVIYAELADRIIAEAQKYLGTRYRAGGKGPDSFDCSGFTSFIYKQFGYTLSPSSVTQAKEGTEVETSASDGWKNMQIGDIVVFSGRRNSKKPGHVGIYTGPGKNGSGFEFIHAARDGIRYSNVDEPYYAARFIGVRRILPDFTGTSGTTRNPAMTGTITKDLKIIIHPDGRWEPDKDSSTRMDSLSRNILLLPDGSWCMVPKQSEATATNTNEPAPSIPVSEIKANQNSDNSKAQNNNNGTKARYHKIRKGDTLYKIARRNGTTVNVLCELNSISSSEKLHIGQKIRIR